MLSAVQDGDHNIGTKQIKADGRKVWRAALKFGQTQVEVVVDQLTGIVTWCTRLGPEAQDTFTATVDWNAEPAAGAGRFAPVAGRRPRRASRATAPTRTSRHSRPRAQATGFAPLKSTLQPDGFTLRSVATRRRDDLEAAALGDASQAARTGTSAAPPNEIDQLFTRDSPGSRSRRRASPATRQLASQVDALAGQGLRGQLSLQSEVLQYGAFTGSRAYTWYSPSGPALFVADKEFAVTVRGGITRDDLVSLAEGLEPLK